MWWMKGNPGLVTTALGYLVFVAAALTLVGAFGRLGWWLAGMVLP